MAFDIAKWLTEDLKFDADKAKELAPMFADRADTLEKGYLRQSDYSKQMNDLGKTQKALDDANAKLTAEMAEWAEMTTAEKAQSGDLRDKLDQSQQRVLVLEQKVSKLATDAGIDPKTVLPGGEATPPKKDPVFNADEFSQRLGAQIGGVADYMLTVSAELPAIAQEHLELTGERFDSRAFIAGIKADIKANKVENLDPVKRWEAQYGIAEKRTAKGIEAAKAHDEQIRQETRAAVLSEQALPNTGIKPGSHAVVFKQDPAHPGNLAKRPVPAQRLQSAIAALQTHKYRQAS